MLAARAGEIRCVRLLLRRGARVFAHVDGSTSRYLAMGNGHAKIAELLEDAEEEEIEKGEEQGVPEWTAVYDPAAAKYYYFHNYTGVHTWKRPADFDGKEGSGGGGGGGSRGGSGGSSGGGGGAMDRSRRKKKKKKKHKAGALDELLQQKASLASMPEPLQLLHAARKLQNAYRQKKAREKMRTMRGRRAAAEDAERQAREGITRIEERWIEQTDKRTRLHYYFNTGTQETTWDKPAVFWRSQGGEDGGGQAGTGRGGEGGGGGGGGGGGERGRGEAAKGNSGSGSGGGDGDSGATTATKVIAAEEEEAE